MKYLRTVQHDIVVWHTSYLLLICLNTEALWDIGNPVGLLMWQQLFVKSLSSCCLNSEKWSHKCEPAETDHTYTSKSLCLREYDLMIKSNGVLFEKNMTRVGAVPKTSGLVRLSSLIRVGDMQKTLHYPKFGYGLEVKGLQC